MSPLHSYQNNHSVTVTVLTLLTSLLSFITSPVSSVLSQHTSNVINTATGTIPSSPSCPHFVFVSCHVTSSTQLSRWHHWAESPSATDVSDMSALMELDHSCPYPWCVLTASQKTIPRNDGHIAWLAIYAPCHKDYGNTIMGPEIRTGRHALCW